jgi:hypothetical protein
MKRTLNFHMGAIAATSVLALTLAANAADITNNFAGTDWSVGGNWAGGTPPSSADTVVFTNAAAGVSTTVDAAFGGNIAQLRINQSTTTATNLITLSRQLAISANVTGLQYNATSGVGTLTEADDFVLSLSGHALLFTANATSIDATFLGTYQFNAAGSAILSTNVGGSNALNLNFGTGASPSLLQVTANGFIMRTNASTSADVQQPMKVTLNSLAALNITDNSTLTMRLDVRSNNRDNADLLLINGGQINIAAGSTLALERLNKSNVLTANRVSDVVFTNQSGGVVTQAGTLRVLPEDNGDSQIINAGTWLVSGTAAKLVNARSNVTGSILPVFVNSSTGLLRGNSTADTVEYDATNFAAERLLLTNHGTIAPGAGTNSLTVGALTLRDINVTFGATGVLALDIAGTASGEFDKLVLATGLTSPTGAGTLDLSATGDKLVVTFVGGFNPVAGDSWTILEYGAVTLLAGVGFDALTIVGASGFAADPANYTITYDATSATLAVIPEPTSAALVGLGLLAVAFGARRQSNRQQMKP